MKNLKFLFFLDREFHIAMFKNLIEYISFNDLGKIGIFSTKYSPSGINSISKGARVDYVCNYLKEYEFQLVSEPFNFDPDITFIADSIYERVEGLGKIINIGHGTISKGSFYTDSPLMFRDNCADLLCVPGIIHKEIMQKFISKDILVSGIPKLDSIYKKKENENLTLSSMNLDSRNKTILFAPTFNPEFSLIPFIGYDLRKYIPVFFNIIIKLHGVALLEWKKNYKKYAEQSKNIYYSEDPDISKFLNVADILLTDLSSVIYEFLSLDKPILLFDSPRMENQKNYNENDIEHRYRDVGYRFNDCNKIEEMLFRSLTTAISQKAKTISQKFISIKDGNSSQKIVLASIQMFKNKKKEALLIIEKKENDLMPLMIKYEKRYEIIILSDSQKMQNYKTFPREKNLLQQIQKISKEFDYEKILFLHGDFHYSDLYPQLMIQHLNNEKQFIVPQIFYNEITEQNIKINIPEISELSASKIAGPLSYKFIAQEKEIHISSLESFAITKNLLNSCDLSSEIKPNLFNLNFAINLHKANKSITLAMDCMIY